METIEAREVVKVISDLISACDELMTEFVSKKRAADWEVINDALVAGARLKGKLEKKN